MSDPMQDADIGVRSIFGAATRRGLVEVTVRDIVGEQTITLLPSKAREIASILVEAATAAEGDEVLMAVLERVGMSPQRAAQVLMAMRQERAILERRARAEARRAVAQDQHDPDSPSD